MSLVRTSICLPLIGQTQVLHLVLTLEGILFAVSVVLWLLYRRGYLLAVRVWRSCYIVFYSFWPKIPYTRPTATIAVCSLLAFVSFLPLTNRLIVNITAVYATILFLQDTLRKQIPLLNIKFRGDKSREASRSELVEDDTDDDVVKQLIEITNEGDAKAENLEVSHRAVRLDGEVTHDWSTKIISGEDDLEGELSARNKAKVEVLVDTVEEYSDQEYYTEVRVSPSLRFSHLGIRTIQKTEPDS